MQRIRFAKATDGTAPAWARTGHGPQLGKAASRPTHVEITVWSHWLGFLPQNFDYLRHGERGCGMSDRTLGALTLGMWIDDLRAAIEAADMPRPFVLLGNSQGAGPAMEYAARYPGEVERLIICGGHARGVDKRGAEAAERLYAAVVGVFRQEEILPMQGGRV